MDTFALPDAVLSQNILKISKLKSLKCIMKKEIWQCTICHLPRKQVKSYIAEGLYAGFSISRKKTHLILHLKWTQMHWAVLYWSTFLSHSWGQRETKKSILPSKAPKWTHFFSACTCWPHHFLYLSLSATDRRLLISFLSFRGGHQGKSKDTRGGNECLLLPVSQPYPPTLLHFACLYTL